MKKYTTEISEVAELLRSKRSVALFSHMRPDGDTIGATIALALALQKLGKNVSVFCDEPIAEDIRNFDKTSMYSVDFRGKYDLLAAVDCGDIFRLGKFSGIYNGFSETLTIDHHGGEYFSKYNCLKSYASTCQIVYEILRHLPVGIDSETATYLYMGLCTDTGNFSNSATDVSSFLMAADMLRLGADITKVNRIFFLDTTYLRTKIQGRAMSRMRSYFNGKLMLLYITQDDLTEFGLDENASEGLVNKAINVTSAVVGVSLCEYSRENFKVSMRGKNFNVRDICNTFGGGGHLYASGCRIDGMLEDVIEKIVREISFSLT